MGQQDICLVDSCFHFDVETKRKILQFWYEENNGEFYAWLEVPNVASDNAILALWNEELETLGEKEFAERISEICI